MRKRINSPSNFKVSEQNREEGSNCYNEKTEKNKHSSQPKDKKIATAWICCIHVFPLFLLAIGMILCFTKLYTSGECEMTWSRRTYIEIPMSNHAYRLWKFVDARDTRGRQTADDHCRPSPIVLYVPGHFGSYEQSRSLGAHGTQLTGRYSGTIKEQKLIQALANTMKQPKKTNDFDFFFYDVYAVDFHEEGTAFHGAIVQRQADFIAATIDQLILQCEAEHVYIVAHSFGGISSKLAVAHHPVLRERVVAMITLATPHAVPIWTWEPQLFSIYHEIDSKPSIPIVSIAGDYRDEMVPPDTCFAGDDHISIHASEITNCTVGMDHRAIVWCHNLLSQVRSMLFTLDKHHSLMGEGNELKAVQDWIQSAHNLDMDHYDFLKQTAVVKKSLMEQAQNSMFVGSLMEIGLLHNMPILIDLFSTIGAFRYSFPSAPTYLILPVAIVSHASIHHSKASVFVFVVLAAVANTVFTMLLWMFTRWSESNLCTYASKHRQITAGLLSFTGGCLAAWLTAPELGPLTSSCLSIFCLFLLLFPSQDPQTIRFGTWLFPLLFPMVMGNWLSMDVSSTWNSTWNCTLCLVPLCLRLSLQVGANAPHIVAILRFVSIVNGVWDNLTSRNTRRHQSFPTFTSLLSYMAILDLTIAFGSILKSERNREGHRVTA